jgi:hypothetical protein
MEKMPKSKGEMMIERLMGELDPASERYQVLASARRFKSSWVELGEQLLRVQAQARFREWGYDSFEEYCAREIRIKQPTAQKLTLAYSYLEKEEPELLVRRTELEPPPDYRSVDLLRRAREEQSVSAEEYAALRRAVVEEERSHPTVLKRFRDLAAPRQLEDERRRQQLAAALAAARRLERALTPLTDLPEAFPDQLGRVIARLEEQVAAIDASPSGEP